MTKRWTFDPAPPSGKRTGGSAAEYSFKGGVDVLAREAIQNSLDARIDEGTVGVTFRFVELTGRLKTGFLNAMDWKGLEDNLLAVPQDRGGKAIRAAVKRLESEGLRLLVIEDFRTKGLEGSEQRASEYEKNPFCALAKDELYSDKPSASSGGSFGLGKSVLWAFSGLKTVLLASVPRTPPAGHSGLRFIGRAELPWHETTSDGACTGSGWLGEGHGSGHERRSTSMWAADAEAVASACICSRRPDQTGLSAVIVGYAEPGEGDSTLKEEAEKVVAAVMESFWPSIVRGNLRVTVRVEANELLEWEAEVDPQSAPGFVQLGDLLRAYDQNQLADVDVVEPGSQGKTQVVLHIPQRLGDDPHGESTSAVEVLVRVLSEGEHAGEVVDRIFRFRGPGMIVRGEKHTALSLGAQPFVAAVLAGEAAGSTTEHRRAERFLRAAEPPAHDEWTHNTRSIKQDYKAHGTKKKLDEFDAAVKDAVRRLVSKETEKGGSLPRELTKYLRFSHFGGGKHPQFLSVTHQHAIAADGAWSFGARCKRMKSAEDPWHLVVRLKYGRDGGGADVIRAIGECVADSAQSVTVEDGVATILLPPSVDEVTFEGKTDPLLMPLIGTRGKLALVVDGAAGVPNHA